MNTILTASNAVLSLITVPYVTRVLSVEGFGAVGFAQNVASWFSVFCLFGIPLYGVRECAKVRDDKRALAKVVKELLTLLTIFTSIFLVVFAACIVVVPQLRAQAPLMWIFLVNTLLTSYGAEWFFQAIEQYCYITIRSVVFKTITLIAILLFVKNPNVMWTGFCS
ncbi:oligosaccharide flippase family protein [Bifidobacterium mongoliense]|uniref:oligosaccharide flippase family protein n=1 Tax=Bifidobacterium mongoliense TaxID=518643 RepID=UPI0030EC192A